jgi:hypothetical protein
MLSPNPLPQKKYFGINPSKYTIPKYYPPEKLSIFSNIPQNMKNCPPEII